MGVSVYFTDILRSTHGVVSTQTIHVLRFPSFLPSLPHGPLFILPLIRSKLHALTMVCGYNETVTGLDIMLTGTQQSV